MSKKEIEKLREEIIMLKQLNEQLESDRDKAWNFIEENYPTINAFEVQTGWHGAGTSTYKVIIDVMAHDLHKIVRYLTHKSLRAKKWTMIKSELREQIRKEEAERLEINLTKKRERDNG